MHLYNSLTRKKDFFIHNKNTPIKLYVCGITPYDTTHLGHVSTYIFFDVLVRYLVYKSYKVNYVQNVTDIDDDILREAKKANQNWKTWGEIWTKRYLLDMKALNVLPPTHFIKATDSIDKMIQIIEALVKIGFAYKSGGNVYFSTEKDGDYGKLSRFNREQMLALSKERGGNPSDPRKKDPLDFLLWQKSKPGEPFWESPFGHGRTGWHIECSSMVHHYLGEQIDMHGGGKDLTFPHHESEIAQSEAYTGKKPFSRFFLHTGMVLCNGEKMSKSLGNLIMVEELLKKYGSNAIRWYILSRHYRQPFDYIEEDLASAKNQVHFVEKRLSTKQNSGLKKRYEKSMDDDFDTLTALSILTQYPNETIFKSIGFMVK